MSTSTSAQARRQRARQHAYPNPYRFPWLSSLLATVLGITLFGGVSYGLISANLDRKLDKAVIDISEYQAQSEQPERLTDDFAGRPVNILVAGIDSRYGRSGELGAGTTADEDTIRSDATMLLHLSADRQRVVFMSIPRDLLTDVPSCTTGEGVQTAPYYGMFNSAFSTGAGTDDVAGGVACTVATTSQLTGLTIDGFVVMDFAGFADLIDTLGGVEMCFDTHLEDPHSGLSVGPGCEVLDGTQGLAFARARKDPSLGDGSDIHRMGRQHELLGSMMSTIMESKFTDLPSLYAFVQEAMHTGSFSQSLSNWRTDAALVNSIRNTPPDDVRFVTMPWNYSTADPNRVELDAPLADPMFEALRNDQPLPPGIVYRNMAQQAFIVNDDGTSSPVEQNEWGEWVPVAPPQSGAEPPADDSPTE